MNRALVDHKTLLPHPAPNSANPPALVSRTFAVLLAGLVAAGAGCATASGSRPGDSEPLYLGMTDDDVAIADATVQKSLETQLSNTTLRWTNPTSGNSGSITPMRTYRTADGTYCREYREIVSVANDSETYRDTACRRGGGFWQPI